METKKEAVLPELNIQIISLKEIKESKANPRKHYDKKKIEELAESIKSVGLIQPITVRPVNSHFEVVAGFRRLKAADLAGLLHIPSIVKELTDEQAGEIQIIENLQREDINPMDEATGYQVLIQKGIYTPESIAGKIGKSVQYVYQRLQLTKLIPKIAELLITDKIKYGVASLICRIPEDKQKEILKEIEDEISDGDEFSVSETKRWIKHQIEIDLDKSPFPSEDETYPGGACNVCPHNTQCSTMLFPEYVKKRICMNPSCYNNKIQVHIERKEKEIIEKEGSVLKITTNYGDDIDKKTKEKYLGSQSYYKAKKTDKGAKPALIVSGYQGEEMGKKIYVTLRRPKEELTDEQKKVRAQERADAAKRKLEKLIELRTRGAMLNKLTEKIVPNKYTGKTTLHELCLVLIQRMSAYMYPDVATAFKWEMPKQKGNNFYRDYDTDLLRELKKAESEGKQEQFFITLLLLEEVDDKSVFCTDEIHRDHLKRLCVDNKIDEKNIKKEITEELKPSKNPKKAIEQILKKAEKTKKELENKKSAGKVKNMMLAEEAKKTAKKVKKIAKKVKK